MYLYVYVYICMCTYKYEFLQNNSFTEFIEKLYAKKKGLGILNIFILLIQIIFDL